MDLFLKMREYPGIRRFRTGDSEWVPRRLDRCCASNNHVGFDHNDAWRFTAGSSYNFGFATTDTKSEVESILTVYDKTERTHLGSSYT